MPGRIHSRELKRTVCQEIETGQKRLRHFRPEGEMPPAQICREHQLAHTLLLRWRNEYKERGENAFLPKSPVALSETEALEQRVAELERHCGQLSLENALLKKLAQRSVSQKGTLCYPLSKTNIPPCRLSCFVNGQALAVRGSMNAR